MPSHAELCSSFPVMSLVAHCIVLTGMLQRNISLSSFKSQRINLGLFEYSRHCLCRSLQCTPEDEADHAQHLQLVSTANQMIWQSCGEQYLLQPYIPDMRYNEYRSAAQQLHATNRGLIPLDLHLMWWAGYA